MLFGAFWNPIGEWKAQDITGLSQEKIAEEVSD